ncbi:hypothetical protein AMTR_s00056p00035370 [Amborella trichopoda]|uniref:Uncharacterized protein n=1 Tax=Amborella trichopoda TaxID=13333 RepID=U5CY43_AMBTC|nr:hypothetical protein AMTR_s00056p00035370 [Amborella trichopoda]
MRAFIPFGREEGSDPSIDGILFTHVYEWRLNMKNGLATYNMFAKLNFEDLEESHVQGAEERRIKIEYHRLEENQHCSGAVFVSRPGGTDEDDGWIVCYAHNENTNISEVQMIAAKKFTEAPVAKTTIPCRVPYGFHGTFICKTKNDFSKCI